jgi:hypothetical protein
LLSLKKYKFWDSSDGIEEYTTSVTGFINKCIDHVVPTMTVRTYTNQKPWITGNIRTELKARAAAFKQQDTYKKSRYALRRTIKQAKRQHRSKIESYYTGSVNVGCILLLTTMGNPATSCPVTQAYQTGYMQFMLTLRKITLNHA